jgi:general secretion pathway protein D
MRMDGLYQLLRPRRAWRGLALGAALACTALASWAQAPAPGGATARPAGAAPAAAPGPAAVPARPAAGAAGTRASRPAARAPAQVTVNFVNADIEAVTRAFAAMSGRTIAVDPRVKGTITVYSEQPQTVEQAYQSYLAALRGLGYAIVESAGLLKVVPEADAKLQAGTVAVDGQGVRPNQVLTQIFMLRHENPNNLVPVLRPLIGANNTINVSPGSNALVITDHADNLQRLARIIAVLDQPTTDVEVVPLKHALASDIAPFVQRLADAPVLGAGSGAAGAPGAAAAPGSAPPTTVLADPRNNTLIVRAPNRARLALILAHIDKLDRPQQGGGPVGNLWVIHLRNAEAVRLAAVLRAAFATQAGAGGAGSASAGPQAGTTPPSATAPGGAATAPVSAAAAPTTGGFIQADPATNSLIVTGPEPLYRQVRMMVDQLDSRRAQVYIESMIVEVKGDNAADFGFQWQGLIGQRGDTNLIGLGTNLGSTGNLIGLNTGAAAGRVELGQGLNIGLIRNYGGTYALSAIARALQTQANTNIVSTPNLITLDNEEAKIVVGSNVPFITGQFTNTGTATTNPFQTIERKDVGITLRIRPQVGEGGSVRMTIYQESSSVSKDTAPGTSNAGPTTNKRQIETNVVVDDGGIVVLGGLIEDGFTEEQSKVPLLGDIPVIGALFRSQSRTKTRTNLMVFLRPVVLRDAGAGDRLTLDRYDIIRAQQGAAQPAPSPVLPVGPGPVLPPLRAPGAASLPAGPRP